MIPLLLLQELKSTAEARTHLFGDYYLADPWFLALAPVALAVLWYGRARRGRAPGRVPSVPAALRSLPRSWAQRLGWIATLLQASTLVLVAVALARPVRGDELRTTISEGVDIVLLVDRSSSMKYKDLDERHTRLEVVKQVVGDFAVRRMTDRVGAADNVALMTFAKFPQLLCPFTLDVGALSGFLEDVRIVRHELEDGTAIGRGLAKAVALLAETDAESKVVVLLTDGENNLADIAPADAAEMASEEGVRVYTVLAGRYVYQEDIFGRIYPTERQLDSTELEQIAEQTGGRFFRARDRESLEQVYAEIEQLERTERREERTTETYDLYPLVLVPALLIYLLSWLSSSTWARRLP